MGLLPILPPSLPLWRAHFAPDFELEAAYEAAEDGRGREGGRASSGSESDWAGSAHQKVKPRSLARSFVCRSHALAGESFKSPPLLPSLRCSPSLPLPLYPWKIFKAVWGTYVG